MKEEDNKHVNIALSGWSGAGTSTLAMLIALLLKRRYFYIGSVFRSLSERLGYTQDGEGQSRFDADYEPVIGKTIDNYVDYKLLNNTNLVLESDISSFRIGKHPRVYSIFIQAGFTQRVKRAKGDGRKKARIGLEARDKVLRDKYRELWDIDIFDKELIQRKYNLVINNSKLSVEEELNAVVERLKIHDFIGPQYKWQRLEKKKMKLIQLYNRGGKKKIMNLLKETKLTYPVKDMLTEIVKLFPEDVKRYPPQLEKIFLGQA